MTARRIKCFWITPTGTERVWLRRYRSSAVVSADGTVERRAGCPMPGGYHDHMVWVKDRPKGLWKGTDDPDRPSEDSVTWPTHCDCGYAFQADDQHQLFTADLYTGAPDGHTYSIREVQAGAMWDAEWAPEWMRGPDGIALMVKLPNGHDWAVDSEASNCTRTQWREVPDDPKARRWQGREHYCWTRHGDPRTGSVHVDKSGAPTCKAGAGSILSGSYHGFLRHGHLED